MEPTALSSLKSQWKRTDPIMLFCLITVKYSSNFGDDCNSFIFRSSWQTPSTFNDVNFTFGISS